MEIHGLHSQCHLPHVQLKYDMTLLGCFQKSGVPQNGWSIIMENPELKWMIWGENPLFSETSI